MGKQYALKLNTPELRQEAYKAYCDHIAAGYPKKSFSFWKGEMCVSWRTIDDMVLDETEFDPELMKASLALRYKYWLDRGIKLMEGGYKYGSPVVWQTIMRNIFRDYDNWEGQIRSEYDQGTDLHKIDAKLNALTIDVQPEPAKPAE